MATADFANVPWPGCWHSMGWDRFRFETTGAIRHRLFPVSWSTRRSMLSCPMAGTIPGSTPIGMSCSASRACGGWCRCSISPCSAAPWVAGRTTGSPRIGTKYRPVAHKRLAVPIAAKAKDIWGLPFLTRLRAMGDLMLLSISNP